MIGKKFKSEKTVRKLVALPKYQLFIPIVSIGLFLMFYMLTATNYPGGSWLNPDQKGFSFWNNYLCDLLDLYAVNGSFNSGRHFARISLVVLCVGLLFLWNGLPELFPIKIRNVKIMKFSGSMALVITLFLRSSTYDITMRIAGFFGIIAIISNFIRLFKARYHLLFLLGTLCFVVFLMNYYIYETGIHIKHLPFIQKITFIIFHSVVFVIK